MLKSRIYPCILSLWAIVLCAGAALGQNFPNKPVRVVTSEAGGGNDFETRLIAAALSNNFKQQVVVENRPGGGGTIAALMVAKAPADGYTLLYYGSAIWLAPFLRDNVPYDPVRDFSPVTLAVTSPNIVVVHPSLPVKTIKELIALAKARPGQLNYASSQVGSTSHLGPELFKSMAGVNIVLIVYKGTALALNDIIRGEVQLGFNTVGPVSPHVKSGRLRALAVTSAQPSGLYPGIPTVAASGLPGYELETVHGVFAPSGTPPPVINRLNQELVAVLNSADIKSRFLNAGTEAVGSTPEQFGAKVKSEMTRLGKVIRDIGIRSE